MDDYIITVKNIKKSYDKTPVLHNVDFRIKRGEIFSLLGANGAGKTTIIKILSTLLKPDAGKAVIDGYDVADMPEKIRSLISLTGQFSAVDGILTGYENLKMIADLRGIHDSDKTARGLLEKFKLESAADRKVSTYSGGMTRRLDIAMSLVGNPTVLFLDEPTTGLDPGARRELWSGIKALQNGGTTVFLTTQYLEEAEELADHIAILGDGRIIADGTLDELKRLLPPKKKEYVEKQPTLEDLYFAITGGEK